MRISFVIFSPPKGITAYALMCLLKHGKVTCATTDVENSNSCFHINVLITALDEASGCNTRSLFLSRCAHRRLILQCISVTRDMKVSTHLHTVVANGSLCFEIVNMKSCGITSIIWSPAGINVFLVVYQLVNFIV